LAFSLDLLGHLLSGHQGVAERILPFLVPLHLGVQALDQGRLIVPLLDEAGHLFCDLLLERAHLFGIIPAHLPRELSLRDIERGGFH